MAKTKVTIPAANETRKEPYLVTDFAIASGAYCDEWKEKDGVRSKSGSFWLRMAEDEDNVSIRHFNGEFDSGCPSMHNYGVLVQFQNPKESGIDVKTINNKNVLTIDGKTPIYPQALADQKAEQEMLEKLQAGNLEWLAEAYTSSDKMPNYNYENRNKPFTIQQNNWCRHNDKIYAHVKAISDPDGLGKSIFRDGTIYEKGKDYFFECQPILAEQKADGSIQCNELLATCMFEPQDKYMTRGLMGGGEFDTDELEIGKFLNEHFFPELKKSLDFTIEQSPKQEKNENLEQQKLRTFKPPSRHTERELINKQKNHKLSQKKKSAKKLTKIVNKLELKVWELEKKVYELENKNK